MHLTVGTYRTKLKEDMIISKITEDIEQSRRDQISWQHFFVIGIGLAFLPTRFDIEYSLIFEYSTHKILHILGAIMFVGNVLVSMIWMFLANRTKNNDVILFASKSIDELDRFLTAPALVLIIWNGLIMADTSWGGPFNLNWMISAILRLLIVVIIWVLILVPNQRTMIKTAQEAVDNNADLSLPFNSAYKKWLIWGIITILILISIVDYMITKPLLDFD